MDTTAQAVPVIRFTREKDHAILRRFLYPRPNARLSDSRVPECHNVVGLANYDIQFDQFKLLREFPNIEYQQKDFPAVIWRGRPPRGTTLLVFKSGRTVQMGMYSDMAFNHAVQRFRLELIQKSYMPSLKPLRFENRVFSHEIGFPIRVWEIEFQDELGCAYIPSLFPGLVYRMFRPPVTALVFESGKLMLLGVRHKEHLDLALNHLEPILTQHRHYAHNPDEQRKAVARQADRALHARARIDQLDRADPQKVKAHKKRMQKAVRIASKSTNIFSLNELQQAIDLEYQKLSDKEQKKKEKDEKKRQETERQEQEIRARQEKRQARHMQQSEDAQEDDPETRTSHKKQRNEPVYEEELLGDMPDLTVQELMK